jgi:cytoskeletal protein RodZ
MANGIEKLLEMDLKEVTKHTHIETEYLRYMCEKNFEKLRKLNASGFAKILSREYDIDLQGWIDEYNEYCKEHNGDDNTGFTVAPKLPAYTPKTDNSTALTVILVVVLIIVALVWVVKFTNILDNIELPSFDKNQSVTYSANAVVESAKENLEAISQTIEKVVQKDENITTESNQTQIDSNSTSIETNATTELKTQTLNIETTKVEVPQIAAPTNEIAKIIPTKNIWIGIKDIDGKNKRFYTTKNPIDLNLSTDQLIQTGHGELILEIDGDQKKFSVQKPLRFVIQNGTIRELEYGEFVKLNKGSQW